MKMKNYLKLLSSIVLLAFIGSCSSEDGKESVSGQGSIMLICQPICLIVAL